MRAGSLREEITFQQIQATRGTAGTEIENWEDYESVCASAEPLSGQELLTLRLNESVLSVRFRCRYDEDLNSGMRIMWNCKPYMISEMIDPDGRGRELEILASEE